LEFPLPSAHRQATGGWDRQKQDAPAARGNPPDAPELPAALDAEAEGEE
jgi:hypothetical protein